MADLVFRTSGAWGPGKGADLDPIEVDRNFFELASGILALQQNPASANGIAQITVNGTQMTIGLTDGTELGPFTLPVLTFRWRGEWLVDTGYFTLDVVKVDNVGIFLVQVQHTSDAVSFDPTLTINGSLVYVQLFGSADASLSALPDVLLDGLADGDFLHWVAGPNKWENIQLGSMAFQDNSNVAITGGTITGLPAPTSPTDAVTKAYVDALPESASVADNTVLANISGFTAPVTAQRLSDVLDHFLGSTTRGAVMFRGPSGWTALLPGTANYFLQTKGDGVDPVWAVGASGVTDIAAGTGISTGGADITGSGTISLEAISDGEFLANTSGGSAAPIPTTLSALLDHVLTNARGSIITRTSLGWVNLAPGSAGTYLKSQGAGADLVFDSPAGAGTVTSVATGAGLTGGPITATGTVALATISDSRLSANISGSTAVPSANTLTAILDHILGTAQGSVLYRNATVWTLLAPGTSGQVLTTGGSAANISWADVPASPAIADKRVLANISGGSATPAAETLSDILDAILGSNRGDIIYRGLSAWAVLTPGSAGQVLQTGGTGGDPSWSTNGGGNLQILSPAAQDTLYYNASSGKFENVRPKYIIGGSAPGIGTGLQKVLFHPFSKAVTLPANLGAYLGHTSQAVASSPAAGSTVYTLAKAAAGTPTSFSNVATITFAAGAVQGTKSSQPAITFAQGDILRISAPATPDTTLADVSMTIVGFET